MGKGESTSVDESDKSDESDENRLHCLQRLGAPVLARAHGDVPKSKARRVYLSCTGYNSSTKNDREVNALRAWNPSKCAKTSKSKEASL